MQSTACSSSTLIPDVGRFGEVGGLTGDRVEPAMFCRVGLACVWCVLLGCSDDAVVEVDAGPLRVDRGVTVDVTDDLGSEPMDAGAIDDTPAVDVPAVKDVAVDRGAPRDVGPPRTLACGVLARTEDPTSNTVLLGNEAGGQFTLVVDVPVANIGIIARGPVDLSLAGEFVDGVRVVHIVGEGSMASTLYAPPAVRFERAGTPAAPVADVTGAPTMTCASDCEAGRVPGDRGCNSATQVRTYFQRFFGESRRMVHLQTSTFDGLYVFVGRGGCCLP